MDSINNNENRELPSNIKTKLLCMFDLLFCASFYNHLKILPLISCTTIVLKHAMLESKHDTASKHKTHRSQIASGELLSCTEPTHTEGDNCDRHSTEIENFADYSTCCSISLIIEPLSESEKQRLAFHRSNLTYSLKALQLCV